MTTIYVAGFCPRSDFGSVGGFEWRRTPTAAIIALQQLIADDSELRYSYVLRAVELPLNVNADDAITDWLDTTGFELWNVVEWETDKHCAGCGVPFTEKDIDGARCLSCGRAIP